MTWHHVRNYGTALQAYALKTIIERNGCSVDLIDYRREWTKPVVFKSLSSLFWSKLKSLRKRNEIHVEFKNELFESFFENKFTYTVPCRYRQDLDNLNDLYDAFVCGSDQIWGPEWFNPVYFLNFVTDKQKLIAYGPSIGVDKIMDNEIYIEMKNLINRFSSVSIRESSGCRIVEEMGMQSVSNVLDPVFLLSKDDWLSLSKPVHDIPTKYSIVFFLKNNECNIKKCLDYLNEKTLYPIVFHSVQSSDNSYANFDGCSVEQLLYLINHAETIYTDSFHITVLSIIFEKKFTLFLKNGMNDKFSKNSRLTDLLAKLGLINNIFDFSEKYDYPINYENVLVKINQLKNESYGYLHNQLGKVLKKRDDGVVCTERCCCSDKSSKCCGKINESFRYIQNKNKLLSKRMMKWAFSLEEKCYTCKYLDRSTFYQSNRPLFYKRLNNELKQKKSPFWVYMKYYIAYDLPMLRRKK